MLQADRKPSPTHMSAILNAEGSEYVMTFQRTDGGDFHQSALDALDGTAALEGLELKVKLPDGTTATTGIAESFLFRAIDNYRLTQRRAAASQVTLVENIDRPLIGAERGIVSTNMLTESTKDALYREMQEITRALQPAEDVVVNDETSVVTNLSGHMANFHQRAAARITAQATDPETAVDIISTPFERNVCDAVDMFLPRSISVASLASRDVSAMAELWRMLMKEAFNATPEAARGMYGVNANDEIIEDLVSICERVPTPAGIQQVFDDLMPNYTPECVLYSHENFKMLLTSDEGTSAAYFAPTPEFVARLNRGAEATPLQIEPPRAQIPAPVSYKEQLMDLGFVETLSSGWTKYFRGTEFLVGSFPNSLTQEDPGPVALKSLGRSPEGNGQLDFENIEEAIQFILHNRPSIVVDGPSA